MLNDARLFDGGGRGLGTRLNCYRFNSAQVLFARGPGEGLGGLRECLSLRMRRSNIEAHGLFGYASEKMAVGKNKRLTKGKKGSKKKM